MFHRRPSALGQLSSDNSSSLARLTGLYGLARALLVGIIPLTALDALSSKAVWLHEFSASIQKHENTL